MARIKFVAVSDLVSAKPKARQPSPLQLAVMKRESEYEKALAKLTGGTVAVFEPTEEKLATLRISLARVIARNQRAAEFHLAAKGGVVYVALEPIPGARSARKKA
jgi:uncharacterized protein YacL